MTELEQEKFADLVAELENASVEAVRAIEKVKDRLEETKNDKEVSFSLKFLKISLKNS